VIIAARLIGGYATAVETQFPARKNRRNRADARIESPMERRERLDYYFAFYISGPARPAT